MSPVKSCLLRDTSQGWGVSLRKWHVSYPFETQTEDALKIVSEKKIED